MRPSDICFKTPDWKAHEAEFFDLPDDAPRRLGFGGRDYQIRFYEAIKGKRMTLLISPTGTGKSIMKIFQAAHEIIASDYQQKQVFVVPELLIGNEFSEQKHRKIEIEGEVYDWEITTNCVYNNAESVARIKRFLLDHPHPCNSYRKAKVLGGVTALVTYQALLKAWSQMSDKEKKRACENTTYHVDESHHLEGVSDEDSVEGNRLGGLCQFIIDHDDPSSGLHLATASFFRTTGFILSQEYLERFSTFTVSMPEHWASLNLEELQVNYAEYKSADDLMDQIVQAVKSDNEPSLIYVPRDASGIFRTTPKNPWVEKLVLNLEELYPGRVLDLVSPSRQKQDKARFVEQDQDFQVVVTCFVGREGADWKALSRIHNTYLDNSVLPSYQKIGRLLRPHDGKTKVRMTNYIRHFESWDASPESVREKLSDVFNGVMLSSLFDDFWFPIFMPVVDPKSCSEQKLVTLIDLYGHHKDAVIDRLVRDCCVLEIDAESVDLVINAIVDDFSEYELEDVDRKDILERLRKEVLRRFNPNDPDLRSDGFLIDFIRKQGWDKVVRENISGRWAFQGVATVEDLKTLSAKLNDWFALLEEVKKIGLDNIKPDHTLYPWSIRVTKVIRDQILGEVGENCEWTKRLYDRLNGSDKVVLNQFAALPGFDRFGVRIGEIERRSKRLSYEEAKELVRSHGIKTSKEYKRWQKTQPNLPSQPYAFYPEWTTWYDFLGTDPKWTERYFLWEDMMPFEEAREYVRSFEFKSKKAYEEWHASTNQKIPLRPDVVYKDQGWDGWIDFLRDRVAKKKAKKKSQGKSWHQLASELKAACNNNDKAKCSKYRLWFAGQWKNYQENNLSEDKAAIFASLASEPLLSDWITSQSERMEIIERLVKENNGMLPAQSWFSKNGYGWILSMQRCQPELFEHLEQEKLLKTPDEWRLFGLELIEKHGDLPKRAWFKENGYGGFINALYESPKELAEVIEAIKASPNWKAFSRRPTQAQYVVIAESLAKNHGGFLPIKKWLEANGHKGLTTAMRKSPAKFRHLKTCSKICDLCDPYKRRSVLEKHQKQEAAAVTATAVAKESQREIKMATIGKKDRIMSFSGVTPEFKEAIKTIAQSRGVSMSTLIRETLEEAFFNDGEPLRPPKPKKSKPSIPLVRMPEPQPEPQPEPSLLGRVFSLFKN